MYSQHRINGWLSACSKEGRHGLGVSPGFHQEVVHSEEEPEYEIGYG